MIPAELSRRLRLLGDTEIAQLLDHEVCANMSILAPEATGLRRSRVSPSAIHGQYPTLFDRQEELVR